MANNMKITDLKFRKIEDWKKWHVWFISFVIDWSFKVNNVAIFSRLNSETYRLVFPEKKIWDTKIQILFPISKEVYFEIEKIVNEFINK